MKLTVSNECFSELSIALTRVGRTINDGATPLTINKDDAIFPPQDFRLVAVRQNCLMAASEVFKINEGDFLQIAQDIFNWCLTGENAKTETQPEPKD